MLTLIASVIHNPKDNTLYIGDGCKQIIQVPGYKTHFIDYIYKKNVIMGYNAFRQLGILPASNIYVLSKRIIDYIKSDNVYFCNYINFKDLSAIGEEYIVCGGESVFRQSIPYADKVKLMWIETYPTDAPIGNRVFPNIHDYGNWMVSCDTSIMEPMPFMSTRKKGYTIQNYKWVEFTRV